MDYDEYQVATAPAFLRGENGTLWNRVLGIVKDAFVAGAKAAVTARFPSRATPDTLVHHLEHRRLDPAWNENAASALARVKNAWKTWNAYGTLEGFTRELQLAGYVNFRIVEQPQDSSLQWFEFDIVVEPPFPWEDRSRDDGAWNDYGFWNDGGSYSSAVPPDHLARLRLIAKKKATHARCRQIVVIHVGETWDATAPPGTWDDDAAATWTDAISYIAP